MRITARVHFIDQWEGENVILSVNNNVMWIDGARSPTMEDLLRGAAINVCGGNHPDARLSVPVDIITRHTDSQLLIDVSSTLSGTITKASFGIDDVSIYIM